MKASLKFNSNFSIYFLKRKIVATNETLFFYLLNLLVYDREIGNSLPINYQMSKLEIEQFDRCQIKINSFYTSGKSRLILIFLYMIALNNLFPLLKRNNNFS